MKIYISGPITGVDDYMLAFSDIEDKLIAAGFNVINPARVNSVLPANCTTWGEYMEVDRVLLQMCDAIYMLPGWENSAGAKTEYNLAKKNGLIVLSE